MRHIERQLLGQSEAGYLCRNNKIIGNMRTKNTVINSIVTLSFQIAILLIGFIVPRQIISIYGSEVNGLTSNINQIINIINLLQAGLVGASIFEMYKPIADGNFEKIGSIFYSSKRYFDRMSILFFAFVLLMIPYLLNGKESNLRTIDIIISVVILGFNATFIFKCYCKYDVIFSAHQKKYILIFSQVIEKAVYYILLFIIMYFKLHYLFMYLAVLIGSIFKVWYVKIIFSRDYYKKIYVYCRNTNYKIKNQIYLLGNQIIQNLIESMPIVFVTYFNGLKYASVLSIYLLVANFFKMIFSTLQNSVAASFGDLASLNDSRKTSEIFGMLQIIFSGIMVSVFSCLNVLYLSFINLYTKGAADFSYIFKGLSISIILYLVCNFSFLCYNMMINSLGLYGRVLKVNLTMGLLSLAVMIFFAKLDFEYVYIGSALFYAGGTIHRHFFLRSQGLPISIRNLFYAMFPVFLTVFEIIILKNLPLIRTFKMWILIGIIIFIVSTLVNLILLQVFSPNDYARIKSYFHVVKRR